MARILYPHLSEHLASRLEHDYTSRLSKICHEIFSYFKKSVQILSFPLVRSKKREELHLRMKKVKLSHCSLFLSAMLLPTETTRIILRFFPASVEGTMLLL